MKETESRKLDHIKICMEKNVAAGRSGFSDIDFRDVNFVHNSLPEKDFSEIKTDCRFLGKKLGFPLMIAGMTGGTPEAYKINKNLAAAAQKFMIAMGVGSQRAAIENPKLEKTYHVRDVAPDIFLASNLGIVQFVKGYGLEHAKKAVEMIKADALALHMNALQEVIQPEGDTEWKGCLEKIKEISKGLGKPVIAKETGAGIGKDTAIAIEKAGASAIDIGGAGGTSWSLIENYRSVEKHNAFNDWGIPTAISLVEVSKSVKIPVIATGGIRNGIEIAKALALGADIVGMALPFLKPASKSHEDVEKKIYSLMKELRIAMFLVGAKNLEELRKKPLVVTGLTGQWLDARGFDLNKLANRK